MSIMYQQKPSKPVVVEESEIKRVLEEMEKDASLNTEADIILPQTIPETDRDTTFAAKHLAYLKGHPKINAHHYLANLRTVLRIRT